MNEQEKDRLLLEHPEYTSLIQYVDRKSCGGFWRTIPYTNKEPTARQLAHRQEYAKIAYRNYGRKGYSKDGTPIITHKIGEAMRNSKQRGLPTRDVNLRIKLENLSKRLQIQIPLIRARF